VSFLLFFDNPPTSAIKILDSDVTTLHCEPCPTGKGFYYDYGKSYPQKKKTETVSNNSEVQTISKIM